MSALREVFKKTDWKLLAEQKAKLIERTHDSSILTGVISWIDAIQEAAHEDGYPVVFLEDEEIEGVK